MPIRKTLKRILKFLGKAILGLIALLILLILIIHLHLVQRKITQYVNTFLSNMTEGRIKIDHLHFSILGNVEIQGLKVWDPDSNQIFSVGIFAASVDPFDIISGDLVFGEIRIEDVKGHLIQKKDGLNIQFIMDAFASTDSAIVEPSPVKLVFKNVLLKNIEFAYTSTVDDMDIKTNLGSLVSENIVFSTLPNSLSVDLFCLDNVDVQILSASSQDTAQAVPTTEIKTSFTPDFGIGMGLSFQDIEINNVDFSYQVDSIYNAPKFDPAHLDIHDIKIDLSDILVREDTLAVNLKTLSADLPCFALTDAGTQLHMNQHQVSLSGFHFTSHTSTLTADLKAWYDLSSPDESGYPNVEIVSKGQFNPEDFSCFLSDSNLMYVKGWKSIEVGIDGHYAQGSGQLNLVELKTNNSHISVTGSVNEIWDMNSISWKDIEIDASVGPDFKTTMAPFIGDIKVPPSLQLQLSSSGNPKKLILDSKLSTTWGNAQAKGTITLLSNDIDLDLKAACQKLQVNEFIGNPSVGAIDMTMEAKGRVGQHQDAQAHGVITSIVLMDKPIHDITFDGNIKGDQVISNIQIADSFYVSKFHTEINFGGLLQVTNETELTQFHLGHLLDRDTALVLSGNLSSGLTMSTDSLRAHLFGQNFIIKNSKGENRQDSFSLQAMLSPHASEVHYKAGYSNGDVTANFDLRELPVILKPLSNNILNSLDSLNQPGGTKTFQFNFQLNDSYPFQLAGITLDEFHSLHFTGDWEESNKSLAISAQTGKFKGFGISMDTLYTSVTLLNDSVIAGLNINNLYFNTLELGNLSLDLKPKGDTVMTKLLLLQDSVAFFGLGARILRNRDSIQIFTDQLQAFEQDYKMDGNNVILFKNGDVSWKDFRISQDNMKLNLDGDLNALNTTFDNIDLSKLNSFMPSDSMTIDKGYLTGKLSYAIDQPLDLKIKVDSLVINNSIPLTITASAVKDQDKIPFEFVMSSDSNKIDAHGLYLLKDETVDADLVLDINKPEQFAFLYSSMLEDLRGKIQGEAKITGPVSKPEVKGFIQFKETGITTLNPRITLKVKDDKIRLDSSGIFFDHFTLYDNKDHQLTIDGNLVSKDYTSYAYDLQIKTDQFALINTPPDTKTTMKGLLSIGSDISLKGNGKDTEVKAKIIVQDTTHLIYVMTNSENDLLNTIGIVDFIDPNQLDSLNVESSETAYDSLVASLPDFKLNANITIESDATLKVITDEQSGDYFQSTGGGVLELGFDRSGNPELTGDYTIKKGVYRMSFYDLVKKNFDLVPGSSINWSGNPENGEINITANHTVATNSIGLIGHEIGESEKSIYKRSLDYIIGITIKGTLEKPIITFTLDLPEADRANYPVLANKLDRLKQPEFQSDLNKQVFGLLVLGGFLPESNVGDVDQSQVATTAIYNSINAILAAQVNRFASQYIKGVDIDVGIQSYNDYSVPGGKTQTAMDFRVSKSILNDRLSFEVGGDFDISQDQSGANTGNNYRGDVAVIYDLTGNGDKQLKLFNNETYDIIYQEIRNTGISLIFIREFDRGEAKAKAEAKEKAKAEEKAKEKNK